MKFTNMLHRLLVASLLTHSSTAFVVNSHRDVTTALQARKSFIAGNWKLNPQTKQDAIKLATEISDSITQQSPQSDVALFVPYVFIEAAMQASNGKLQVGAEVSKQASKETVNACMEM
jgi:Triosephosphate isomerase